jgi:phosphatidate cytidylyltransferase
MGLLQDKNFQTRALTGILFVGVIVACIFINVYTFLALIMVINFFCLREFYNLTIEGEQKFFKWYSVILGLFPVLFISTWIPLVSVNSSHFYFVFLFFPFLILFFQLFYSSDKPFSNIAFAYLGFFYISMPLCLMLMNVAASKLYLINYLPDNNVFGSLWVQFSEPFPLNVKYYTLLLFILVWINDTGAYITGVSFGKTKLLERISPKKTWEGTIGGVVLCMIVAAFYGKYVLHDSLLIFCGLGLVIGVFATLGDLIESQLKRSLNIKDSGTMLPGHGGFLDRFDGFLMAMPAAYFYMLLVR